MNNFFNLFFKHLKFLHNLNRTQLSNDTIKGLKYLKKNFLNVKFFSIPSGTIDNHWIVPNKWEAISAKIFDKKRKKIVWDAIKEHKLSLFTFSPSFKGKIKFKELIKNHFLYDKSRPNSYIFHFRNQYRPHNRLWGFSIPYNKLKKFNNKDYYVDIQTKSTKSKMQMAYQVCKGKTSSAVCFVSHFDHPFQSSDGLSACVSNHLLIDELNKKKTNLSYIALSSIEIIGSHFFVKKLGKKLNIKEAISINTPGANGVLNYSYSYNKVSIIDRIINNIILNKSIKIKTNDFRGSMGADEIVFDASGIDISCGSLHRFPYKEYHTSDDTPSRINKTKLQEFLNLQRNIIYYLENNFIPINLSKGLNCFSHPEIDLYIDRKKISGLKTKKNHFLAKKYKNFDLNKCLTNIPREIDGKKSLLDISEKLQLPFKLVEEVCFLLKEKKLVHLKWSSPFLK